jgi:hypothetical protein
MRLTKASPLAREATLSAAVAATAASLLVWLGPPGADLAEHAYQRTLFLQHGFTLWNNFWYAGRYSFVTYSVLYYPIAAFLGIRLLAVATVSTAALAFAFVVGRQWGPAARWSSRTFAVVWAGIVLSAAFPFALGAALALVAVWRLQARRMWQFTILVALTLAASPLAFLLLTLLLAGVGVARWRERSTLLAPAVTLAAFGAVEVVLWRLFPGGRYPFSLPELGAALVFCVLGAALTWRIERAKPLLWLFLIYLAACVAAYLIPSAVGENVARLRYAAVPVAVLALSLRRWRPLPVCLGALALAVSWNVTPIFGQYVKGMDDPAANQAYWQPAISYLHDRLTPAYRVEAVDTVGHWAAVYLAEAQIPLARGDFRQDDFPQNKVLYNELGPSAYLAWLRGLGVRYVVLTNAPPDYSAQGEASLLRSGRSGLRPVFRSTNLKIFAVPDPRPILTGFEPSRVLKMSGTSVRIRLAAPGVYRLAVRYSPYWHVEGACLSRRPDGMTNVAVDHAGPLDLTFHVNASRAIAAVVGTSSSSCDIG